jgi:ABC-type enterochelin transport system ATPase subunit
MANTQLAVLTDAELDFVAAGQSGGNQQRGLVNAADILNNNDIRILNNSLNNNDVAVSVGVLGVARSRAGD